jgi:hypothetical protein
LERRLGEFLLLRVHSMGLRIALMVLERFGREGFFDGRDADVVLVALFFGGYRSANFACLLFWLLLRIKNV